MKSYKVLNRNDFYATIKKWWSDWDFPIFGVESLPENIVVVYHNEEEVCAIPVYLSDSNVCWIGFITSNKLASKEARKGSLTFGLKVVSEILEFTKYRHIFTVTGNAFIDKSLNESEFTLANKNIKEYIKNI